MRYSAKLFGLAALTVLMVPVSQIRGFSQTTEGLEQVQTSEASQSESADDLIAEADQLFNEASQLSQMSQFQSAQNKLQQALELYQNPAVRQSFLQESQQGEAKTLNRLGEISQDLGEYEQALRYFQDALIIQREIGDLEWEGIILNSIGSVYRNLYQDEQALSPYQQALTIFQEIGDQSWERVIVYALGSVHNNLGQHKQALNAYQDALSIAREIGDREWEGITLNSIGSVYSDLYQYEQALSAYQEALVIFQEIGDQSWQGIVLSSMGSSYDDLYQYEQALNAYQEALVIFQEIGDQSWQGMTLNSMGSIYNDLYQYEQALNFYQKALVIFQEIGDQSWQGMTLNSIGGIYDDLYQYEQALDFYQKSFVIAQEIGDSSQEGATLNNIGLLHNNLNQYEQALSFYQDALAIAQGASDSNLEGTILNNLGITYSRLSQYQQALNYYQKSLAIDQQEGDRNGEGITLNNIGLAYDALNQYEQALNFYRNALAAAQETRDRNLEGTVLNNIGITHDSLNQYQQALDYYQNALTIAQEIGDRRGEGIGLNNVGLAYDRLDQPGQALMYYQDALVITQEIDDFTREGIILHNIGDSLAGVEKPELAIVFLKQAVNIYESIRSNIRTLDEELQSSYTKSISDTYRILAELLLQQDRILEAQEVLDLLKLQELDDYLRDIRRGSDIPIQQLDFWPAEQAILNLYNQQLQADSFFSFPNFIDSPEVAQYVEQLRRTAQGQNLNPDQLARLQDNLQQVGNAALLYPLILDDRIELVLVTSCSLVRETVPVDRVELNRVITDFRTDITDPGSDPTANAQKLYQWLIAPIAQQLEQAGADTILYAADGTLRYIPLAALHDGEQWLTQQYTINHITAASLTDFRRDRTTDFNILAGAFPADRGYSVDVNGESKFYQGLPAAEIEVETIQSEFPSTNALFDQQFNPDAVVPQLSNYSIVHFATHAQFVSGFPHESFILFGNGERVTLRDIGEWSLPQTDLVVLSACETAVSEELGNGEEILGFGYQMQRIGVEAAIASLWQVSDGGTQVLMNTLYAGLQDGFSTAAALQQAQRALIEGDCFGVENCDRSDPRGIAVIGIEPSQPSSVSTNLSHPYYWAPFILIGNGL